LFEEPKAADAVSETRTESVVAVTEALVVTEKTEEDTMGQASKIEITKVYDFAGEAVK
jgi:hypothetical protein